jgi:SAM-dependent methyltransferase
MRYTSGAMTASPSPPQSHHAFYDDAHAYDVAFAYRDVEAELDFLLAVARTHGQGEPRSFLELAAGPGYHALAAARRGLSSTALDLSAPMIARAREKAAAAGVVVDGIVADMADFTLPAPVDLACNLLTSISYLTSTQALHHHFRSVARVLRTGGVYVVENNHPRDYWTREHFQPSRWTMSATEGDRALEVTMSWIDEPPVVDIVAQTYSVKARTEVIERAPTGEHRRTLVDQAVLRMIWPQELVAHGLAHGLTLARFYGDLDVDVAIDDPQAWRTVAVFVKSPG